jgi:prepilin-type processing-associated H-X9-DG protein
MEWKENRGGFALVELLVVAAVIMALAVLFFLSAFGRARQQGQDLGCLNNLRRLTLGWQMYCADNQGVFPGNDDEGSQPPNASNGSLDPQWCPGRMDPGTSVGAPTNVAWIKAGQIYPYVGNPAFYRCPADSSSCTGIQIYPTGGPGAPRVRSVSMNGWINPPPSASSYLNLGSYRAYRKESDLAVPGARNLWLLIDENPYTINDALFFEEPIGNASPPTATAWDDSPAVYHNGSGGISFCDGHVQMRKWTDPVLLNIKPSLPGSFAATPPRTDLVWLLQQSTAHQKVVSGE